MAHAGRLFAKVSIVTGSSSGIGRAIALAFANQGSSVVCADLTPRARSEVPDEIAVDTDELIRHNGGHATFVMTDVGSAPDVEVLVKKAVEKYGRVDILVNNAGISIESTRPPAKIHETAEDVWDLTMKMLRQNLHKSGDRGWIINMSSIFGLVGGLNNASYATSKGAVTNLTRQVAIDYADQMIHCNAICPGYTRTAIFVNTSQNLDETDAISARHPFRGVGRPADVVGAAIFLASEEAGWITGVCLAVDGGYTAQ